MKRLRRTRIAGFATAAAMMPAFALAFSASAPRVAVADQTSSYLISSSYNQSDPDIEKCTLDGQAGYCLYTSNDMNIGGQDCSSPTNCQNTYPMDETLGFFSTNGINNWMPQGTTVGNQPGVIFQESQYIANGWVPGPANGGVAPDHLWAPNVVEGNDGNYYLYDPDIWNPAQPSGEDTSSFIGVEESTSGPFGPFTNLRDGSRGVITGAPGTNGGYASDPDVMQDESGTRYLVYANGDANNCGTISESTMFSMDGVINPTPLTIMGVGALGGCIPTTGPHVGMDTGIPYEEGPSLYYTPQWGTGVPGPYLLVFAAKPTNTPSGCSTDLGEPGTNTEVIAYATSNSVSGPFTYDGILMCGSSTEWTDQASLAPIATSSGAAIAMYYHDGPAAINGANPNRKVHATCLMYGNGKFAAGMRPVSTNGGTLPDFSQCASGQYIDDWGFQAQNGTMITTLSNGQLAYTNRIAAGDYEWYQVQNEGGTTCLSQCATQNGTFLFSLYSQEASQYVDAQNGTLTASGGAYTNVDGLLLDTRPGDLFPFAFSNNGASVTLDGAAVQSNGSLKTGGTPTPLTAMGFY